MTLLVLGVVIWSLVHFMPAIAVDLRTSLVSSFGVAVYKILFALVSIASLMFIIVGWKAASVQGLFVAPAWGAYVTVFLTFLGFVLIFAPYLENSFSRIIRHPQLAAVVLWGVGHVFYNGEARSVVLFAGLAGWALVQMILINRRDGAWNKPEPASISSNIRLILTGVGFFALFLYTHGWLFGVGPVPHF
jgi:uncharacterized membrane protein